ncbi:MAG: DUF2959 family protein [Opitutaceae bacterium]|nr:DUF2959 family protein [Opitutaceae bacterium]
MKNPTTPLARSVLVSALCVLLGLAGLTGCQSTKSPALRQGASASGSIQTAADQIIKARAQVNVTTAALRNLVDRPQDIPAQYKTVLAELKKLRDDAASIAKSADAMRAKGDQYIADWAKQIAAISDPELRNAAFDRRAEVATRLQGIFKRYQEVKTAYSPFLDNLSDIQTALGTDLSAKGLDAVRPFVAKATANAEPLKAALDALAADFRAVGVSLQPGGQ